MSSPDFSVVICAYTEERWDDLVAAVESVHNQTLPAREIIVVVDHDLGLLTRVKNEIPGVRAFENHETRGLSGARNSGIVIAQGSVIAFLDDDAIAASDWLEQLATGYRHRDVLGVGGAIEPRWVAGRPRWFPEEFDWVVGCTYRGMPVICTPVRNLIGCNMSLRREVFSRVGGFRSGIGRIGSLPVGCEETELCIRAGQHWRHGVFLYEPNARVSHTVPENRSRARYFFRRCFAEGISKVQVTYFVGMQAGLSNERTYALRTLPTGILTALDRVISKKDWNGLARAGAIIAGFSATATGYLVGFLLQILNLTMTKSSQNPTQTLFGPNNHSSSN